MRALVGGEERKGIPREKMDEGEDRSGKEEGRTSGSIIQGHVRLFSSKLCISGAAAGLRAKHIFCSTNSIVEQLHSRVGGAELEKLK